MCARQMTISCFIGNVLFPSNQTAAKALLARSSNPNNEKEG